MRFVKHISGQGAEYEINENVCGSATISGAIAVWTNSAQRSTLYLPACDYKEVVWKNITGELKISTNGRTLSLDDGIQFARIIDSFQHCRFAFVTMMSLEIPTEFTQGKLLKVEMK